MEISANTDDSILILYVIIGILSVATFFFLVMWLLAVRRNKQKLSDINLKQETRIGLELAVADQVGRMRIIRELHQLAVLQVNQIVTKAEAAKLAVEDSDEYSARAFNNIAIQGADTLADMRRILTLVTEGELHAQPQPRLKSISDLVQSVREAGLEVNLEETGASYELRPGAELAIFRVLQECLTNSLKHGGVGTGVWITLTWTPDGLKLNAEDDGLRNRIRMAEKSGIGTESAKSQAMVDVQKDFSALVQAVTGPGINQMRQRAELFGGYLEAHEVPGVGFSVNATFRDIRLG